MILSALLTLTLLGTDDAKQVERPIQPVPNQHELIERIVATGGDAERVGKYIILVALRDATDKDFELLKDLKAVKYLDCAHCKTDGTGLANIAQMKRLEKLWLHDNKFVEKHLRHIRDLPRLRVLWLENTNVTDCGLHNVRKLESLQELYLANTMVTDKSLHILVRLKKLRRIDIRNTKFTAVGIEELKERLPRVEVWH